MKLLAMLGAGALALGTVVGAAAPAEAQYHGHGRYHHDDRGYHRGYHNYHQRWHGRHGYYRAHRHWHR